MSNYIVEAFKQLDLLEDINDDVTLDASGITELRSFLDDAAVDPDEEMPMDIFDLEAEAKEDLKKSYEGKIILECSVCHSHLFEDKENVSLAENGEVCEDLECPYCMSTEGYYIIGEVAPYDPNKAEEIQDEYSEDEDLPEVDVEDAADKIEEDDLIEESMKLDGVEELYDNDEIRGVEELEGSEKMEGSDEIRGDKHKDPINEGCEEEKIDEGCKEEKIDEGCDKVNESCDSEKVNESIEDVSITTEDETMTMTTKEDGGVVVETSPKEDESEFSDEEMIVPVGDEEQEIIDVAIDANDSEDEEDFSDIKDESDVEDDYSDLDEFDEFDEESFNGLGESYLKNCYENVTGFKTTGISTEGKKLFIEGVIKFDSGNIKETQFIFESVGNNKFEGYNKQISKGKKTFKLNSSINNKKLVCESLNYNYRSKNELNESIRVYGTVKRK